MELKSTINETWKLCTFGSLVGCFIILLSLNKTHHPNFSLVDFPPLKFHPPTTTPEPMPMPKPKLDPLDLTTLMMAPEPEPEPEPEPLNLTSSSMALEPKSKLEVLNSTTLIMALEPEPEPDPKRESLNMTTLTMAPKPEPEHEPEPEPKPEPSNSTTNVLQTKENPNILAIDNKDKGVHLANNPIEKPMNMTRKKCNMFEGRWVYKPEGVPSYNSKVCPFIEEKMTCQKNGRPDSEYENWTWEAKHCDLPLFNGTYMLERMRNKRMIIAGDSLNRNQWESLACLLYTSISPNRVKVEAAGWTYKFFKAKDYNFTLEFYWSPFLVEFDQSQDNKPKILVLDKISNSAKHWRGADVMVFNSGHWWIHLGKYRAWDMIQYKGKLITDMGVEEQFDHGMTTWAKWIQQNVDPNKTRVYFRSISSEHKGKQWCYNATKPILDESYKSLFPKSVIDIVEAKIKAMGTSKPQIQVKYLNITKMSGYRKDAHPSIFRTSKWQMYATKYQRLIPSYADCSHWCLPGLPDTWNRLLYVSLFFDSSGDYLYHV